MSKALKYLLVRDGCELYYTVIEQPEEWRRENGEDAKVRRVHGIYIASSERCWLGSDAIYLRGSERHSDRRVFTFTYADEAYAIAAEQRTHAALAEFVRTGGFNPKPAESVPAEAGPIRTLEVA